MTRASRLDRWFGSTDLERVEKYVASSFQAMFWLPLALSGTATLGMWNEEFRTPGVTLALVAWNALNVGTALFSHRLLHPSLAAYLGARPVPRRGLGVLAVVTVVACVAATLAVMAPNLQAQQSTPVGWWVAVTATSIAMLGSLFLRSTRSIGGRVVGTAAAAFVLDLSSGNDPLVSLVFTPLPAFWVAMSLVTGRLSGWLLRVVHELDRARNTAGRLAIAEERLRFSRDLHDVVGRSLSAVSVKTQLASALVERERNQEAVRELESVRELVAEAQTEMRAVVAGYRRADLTAELAGARGVLTAAGAETRVLGGGPWIEELPATTREALAWVVREGATNVVRHARPSRVELSLARGDGEVGLCLTNDGADARGLDGAGGARDAGTGAAGTKPTRTGAADDGPGGNGLAGLRERLAPLGGRLETHREGDVFVLEATLPVEARA